MTETDGQTPSAPDPVAVADRLLVAAMAACRDLRATATRERER